MKQIFKEASQDALTTRLKTPESESYIFKGVKIINDECDIKIYNTKFNGDYYSEISEEDYEIFRTYGWRIGCYMVATNNNRKSMSIISEKIEAEIKTMSNLKRYNSLVTYRTVIINRFLDTLNLMKSEINLINL